VRRIGEQLGVRYALEGSVRRIEDALRVNTQLIATDTGAHLWADRFDQKLNDLSAGQEEVVYRIGRTLNVALADIENARSKRDRPISPDAFDLVLRARSLLLHPIGLREHAECIDLLERALLLDPNSTYAMTQLAYLLTSAHRNRRGSAAGDLNRVADLIAGAAAIAPDDQSVLNSKAYLLLAKSRYEEAIPAFRHLLDNYPNTENAYHRIGVCMIHLGRAEQAIRMIERSLRLDPRGSSLPSRYQWIGLAYLLLGRDEEAIDWTQRSLAADRPSETVFHLNNHCQLAAAYARLGRLDEAHRAIAEVNRLQPCYTARSTRVGSLEQIERYRAALRLAGLRDHAEEDADFGVPADSNLRNRIRGLTPTTAPGAATIRTADLRRLLDDRKPTVIDAQWHPSGQSIPGAYALRDAGLGGSMSDAMQDRLQKKIFELTKADFATPIVAVGWNSESFDGYNLTLRLVALGHTNVYWYRGGREAWEVASLPETPIDIQDW
jgi:adenylate cyclase